MTPPELAARLADGTPLLLRPVHSGDARLLADGFERLSPQSIRARFLAPVSRLGSAQLRSLVDVDQEHRIAWGALHAEVPDLGLGVARCARIPGEPNVAEVAVTVVDEYQGRGLGILLFTLLAATARGAGIERFRAYVLPDNARVRRAADRFGARASLEAPGLLRYELSLDDVPPARHELVEAGLPGR
ncbi:MAG: GNAT family N-acetyltransferase [Actinomycetota bacterium]